METNMWHIVWVVYSWIAIAVFTFLLGCFLWVLGTVLVSMWKGKTGKYD